MEGKKITFLVVMLIPDGVQGLSACPGAGSSAPRWQSSAERGWRSRGTRAAPGGGAGRSLPVGVGGPPAIRAAERGRVARGGSDRHGSDRHGKHGGVPVAVYSLCSAYREFVWVGSLCLSRRFPRFLPTIDAASHLSLKQTVQSSLPAAQ